MFTLRVKRKQLRIIEELKDTVRGQIRDALNVLKIDPVPAKVFDVKKLEGHNSVYRIRVGSIRMVYSVEWSEKVISIHYIGPRKKAYR